MFLAPGKPEWVNISLCSYVQSNLLGFRYFGNKIQKGFSSFQQVLLNLVCTKLFSHQTNSVFLEDINFLFHLYLTLLKPSSVLSVFFIGLDNRSPLKYPSDEKNCEQQRAQRTYFATNYEFS